MDDEQGPKPVDGVYKEGSRVWEVWSTPEKDLAKIFREYLGLSSSPWTEEDELFDNSLDEDKRKDIGPDKLANVLDSLIKGKK